MTGKLDDGEAPMVPVLRWTQIGSLGAEDTPPVLRKRPDGPHLSPDLVRRQARPACDRALTPVRCHETIAARGHRSGHVEEIERATPNAPGVVVGELDRFRERHGPVDCHPAQNPRLEILHDTRTGRIDLVSPGFATKEPEPQRVRQLQLMKLGKRDRCAGARRDAPRGQTGVRARRATRGHSCPATWSLSLCPSLDHDLARRLSRGTAAPDCPRARHEVGETSNRSRRCGDEPGDHAVPPGDLDDLAAAHGAKDPRKVVLGLTDRGGPHVRQYDARRDGRQRVAPAATLNLQAPLASRGDSALTGSRGPSSQRLMKASPRICGYGEARQKRSGTGWSDMGSWATNQKETQPRGGSAIAGSPA